MPAKTDLDAAQARRKVVLRLIRESILNRGYPPSVSELQRETGVGSSLTTRRDLEVLEASGQIERDPGVPRGIRLV
jgi:repressor LexA